MSGNFDEITINLPKKAEYLSFVRLTVSGLVSKIGFDIDTVEDIKVVVSEICSRIVSSDCDPNQYYDIKFKLYKDGFQAVFKVPHCLAQCLFEGDSGEFAKAIISSLTDEFSITCSDNCIITIGKNLGDSVNG
ncbi:anti-sigma regulatory factor [Thermoclostridium stercorarium subsp. stercorarium DSM 8532]|jgi:serine/threonine-protein kinase RsbW|uniref:Anti-sigma regulatory factor n=3 Tax=Thermoclostridium stercorarium TaxID=1510 RepID=L7VRG2_THES1|nr:anti-sigma regulatory factor [Thermoclostridium stercorarium]AGC69372.1 anti-sigma regulatory factor [Thermoclostridium stercorarium subsp. stercorarium DSM 8532]AGI40332.1 anti-sigma regulator [Thermoclostridium stercorarium subsp. stercorarium DSM 8532]ANW99626.1 anti-sigma regulatory factor [Thermoclostridium stercorarium subsp. thermolacticum DSM 2910]ANX02253.1 anti-sigma regulatory factor [Thermoclostridium stercorarium subsp. leptospartum DSM 9219]UZQ85330.1 anti-sigma regulatory fac